MKSCDQKLRDILIIKNFLSGSQKFMIYYLEPMSERYKALKKVAIFPKLEFIVGFILPTIKILGHFTSSLEVLQELWAQFFQLR